MKYKYGNTQCVSTQVGCRMGCKFCASTLGGLVRNLSSGEILAQVLKVNALHGGTPQKRAVTNVVLMGSGEPLDNYQNVIKFLRDMSAEGGINISPRNVSLSTCGLVPKMYDLAEEGLPVNLTVSLHNVTDEERARTMPIAKRYKISEILEACTNYFKKTGRRYIFEYSLIAGENCDEGHAPRTDFAFEGQALPREFNSPQRRKGAQTARRRRARRAEFFKYPHRRRHICNAAPQDGGGYRRGVRTAESKFHKKFSFGRKLNFS